jgi:hypothetical protein
MFIIDIIISIFAPILIPLYDQILVPKRKPTVSRRNQIENPTIEKELPVFIKEFPTAFIGNAIWGMTYKTNNVSLSTIVWIVVYAFIALFSVALIMKAPQKPNKLLFTVLVISVYILLIVLSLLRIFNIINLTTAST